MRFTVAGKDCTKTSKFFPSSNIDAREISGTSFIPALVGASAAHEKVNEKPAAFAAIFEVWPPLVMTKQRVLAGRAATADLGAFLVWRWLDQRRAGVSTGWHGDRRGLVGRPKSPGVSRMS